MKNFPLDFGVFGCGSGVTSIRNIRYANNTLRGQPTTLDLVRGAQEKTQHPMKEDWTFQTFLYTEVWATEGVVVMGLATAGMSHWKRQCLHQKHLTEHCIDLPPSFVNFVPQENNFTARQARLSIACMKPFPLFEQHPT